VRRRAVRIQSLLIAKIRAKIKRLCSWIRDSIGDFCDKNFGPKIEEYEPSKETVDKWRKKKIK
jgi:hypothetical protein